MPSRPFNPQRRRPYRLTKAIPANLTGTAAQGQIRTADEIAALQTAAHMGLSIPLPRDAYPYAFGPGTPAPPSAFDPVREDSGRPEPRISEYPISWNLPGAGGHRMIPWRVLREAAELPIISDCIRIRKEEVATIRWEIGVARHAVASTQRQNPGMARRTAEASLREDLLPEIARCTEFWKEPDPENGLDFGQWCSALLDERLILDALAIYPHRTIGGDLLGLQIIDGSTIKPLLDHRGGRPQPPYPAYQQNLYGFPRGEFTADVTPGPNGETVIDGSYRSDQLLYFRHTVRTWTPYGRSPVEMSLLDLDTWMKRVGWLRSEYTEGVVPSGWLMNRQTQPNHWTPAQVFEYETSLNDAYGGDVGGRRRVRMLPPGWEPDIQPDIGEKFKPDYDLHLLKLLVAHFDMSIHELGFTETQGLGGSGHAKGQENLNERKGSNPTLKSIATILTQISVKVLGMPEALEFRWTELAEDDGDADQVILGQVAGGLRTLNEGRDELGLPRYAFAEADMAAIIAPRTGAVTFLDGSSIPEPDPSLPAPGTVDNRPDHETSSASANPGPAAKPEVKPPKATTKPAAAAIGPSTGDRATDAAGARPPATKAAEATSYRNWVRKGHRGGKFQLHNAYTPDELEFHRIDPGRVSFKAADTDPKAPGPGGSRANA